MTLGIVAILCVRNESLHIGPAIEGFVSQSIDVVLIDHDSTDDTLQRAEAFRGRGLIGIERLEWTGSFSLSEQLRAKQRVIGSLETDWLIHADADEWLQAPARFEDLRHGIETADGEGFNCINFDEFVFLPLAGESFEERNYRSQMQRYYFFAPKPQRRMRAWRKDAEMRNLESAGDTLQGAEIRVFPENFVLRHYIVLSAAHAAGKYLNRPFSNEDLERGWHRSRRQISPESLSLPGAQDLLRLDTVESRMFDRSQPQRHHFWDWDRKCLAANLKKK